MPLCIKEKVDCADIEPVKKINKTAKTIVYSFNRKESLRRKCKYSFMVVVNLL
jgi:hypothetical protein